MYQDPKAERRNLTVTSLLFIAFYLAGGELAGKELKLQVINIRFEEPSILAIMA